jgi:hypothetical protein
MRNAKILSFMEHDEEKTLSGLRLDVWTVIRRSAEWGRTCDEIERMLVRSHQSVSPRIWELIHQQVIVFSGKYRKTVSGCRARVYVLPKYAKSA